MVKDPREPDSSPAWRSPDLEIRIGISSCLLGEAVRYDGGHRKDAYITGPLSRHFTWVPVCPEMELGLGAPRETLRLVGRADAPRLMATDSGMDLTEAMDTYARARAGALAAEDLAGYILKRASPSCGMERVKVYPESGRPSRSGRGLFAQRLMDAYPLLPVEEEGRLSDARLRDNFITRVFAFRRLRALLESGARARDIVGFHTAHKFLLLAHSPTDYARLGRFLGDLTRHPCAEWLARYGEGFMGALAVSATPRKHVNVLQHIMGFFKARLSAAERRELVELIGDYARGLVPLIVPITLVKHHVARFGVAYVADQLYLSPHPKELMLRNHL
ncbi:MAG TPA: DUF523 and DUF1722 domain-containing protein [Methylomirabilota bacterium]|nr:DUF523 and DUF1722 domain-containing protein [Methylomirabilota bacterium]